MSKPAVPILNPSDYFYTGLKMCIPCCPAPDGSSSGFTPELVTNCLPVLCAGGQSGDRVGPMGRINPSTSQFQTTYSMREMRYSRVGWNNATGFNNHCRSMAWIHNLKGTDVLSNQFNTFQKYLWAMQVASTVNKVTATATATQSGGVINSVTITNPNANNCYDPANPPTATVTGTTGSGAVVTGVVNQYGSIVGATINNGGSSYSGTITITFPAAIGTGTGGDCFLTDRTATSDWAHAGSFAVRMGDWSTMNVQSEYRAYFNPQAGGLPVPLLNMNNKYAFFLIWNDSTSTVNGYASNAHYLYIWDYVANGWFPGIQATATATQSGGVINSFTITNASGNTANIGYDPANPPTITVTGTTGSGAVITPTFSQSTLTGGTITNGGSGYSGTITVTISAPVGTFIGNTSTARFGDANTYADQGVDFVVGSGPWPVTAFGSDGSYWDWIGDIECLGMAWQDRALSKADCATWASNPYSVCSGTYVTGSSPVAGDFGIGEVTNTTIELCGTSPTNGSSTWGAATYRCLANTVTLPTFGSTPTDPNVTRIDYQPSIPGGQMYRYVDANAPSGVPVWYIQQQQSAGVTFAVTPGGGAYDPTGTGGYGFGFNYGLAACTARKFLPTTAILLMTHSVFGNSAFRATLATACKAKGVDCHIIAAGLDGTGVGLTNTGYNPSATVPTGCLTGNNLFKSAMAMAAKLIADRPEMLGNINVIMEFGGNDFGSYSVSAFQTAYKLITDPLVSDPTYGTYFNKIALCAQAPQAYHGGNGMQLTWGYNTALQNIANSYTPGKVGVIGLNAQFLMVWEQLNHMGNHPNGPSSPTHAMSTINDAFTFFYPPATALSPQWFEG